MDSNKENTPVGLPENRTDPPPRPGKGFPFGFSARKATGAAAFLLLLIYFVSAVSADRQKSATFDEIYSLATGYMFWAQPEDSRIYPDSGIVAQSWAALPLLRDSLKFPGPDSKPWNASKNFDVGRRFLYELGNPAESILWQARAMIALLGVVLGALIFLCSKNLFGKRGGLISLFLFAFSPTMLAQGSLVTADLAVSLAFLAATLGFWKVTHTVKGTTLLSSIAALSFLMMSKMSGILILPVIGLIILLRLASSRPIDISWFKGCIRVSQRLRRSMILLLLLIVHAAGLLGMLWLVYNFEFPKLVPGIWRTEILNADLSGIAGPHGVRDLILKGVYLFSLLPPAYAEGLVYIVRMSESRLAFANGHYSAYGWWWFFPWAFLIKTPLPTLLLLALAPVAWIFSKTGRLAKSTVASLRRETPGLYELSPLLILTGVYALVAVTSKVDIGHRYILPLYPPLFILAGMNAGWLTCGRRIGTIMVGGLLLSLAAVSWSIRPDYLAFFNLFSGGPREGYRRLVDSSLDWGQDLPGLKAWLSKNSDEKRERIYLSYFGTASPEYYGIHSIQLPFCSDGWRTRSIYSLKGGVYCISATMLEGLGIRCYGPWCRIYEKDYRRLAGELKPWYDGDSETCARLTRENGAKYWGAHLELFEQLRLARLCAHLRHRQPDAEVGYSILVYRLSDVEVSQALEGEPAELLETPVNVGRNSL